VVELRRLGRSGLEVSAVGLGCNNFGGRIGAKETDAVVGRALDLGVTLFDTADIYGERGGSETLLGRALGKRRGDVVIATKFGGKMGDGPYDHGASRRWIHRAVEGSLKRLGTDWIDVYQLHFPDPTTPQGETLQALDHLVREGKVRYIGCSNFAGWQIAESVWISRTHSYSSYISAQNQYNLLDRRIEREVVPACEHFAIGLLPYFPLASGFLTGKYRRGEAPPADTRMAKMGQMAERTLTAPNFDVLDALETFTRDRGHDVLELAICWLLANPLTSSVIAGATKPEQVTANVKAAQWRLAKDELDQVDRLTRRRGQ
jgi:aryl-alcohol dehydrogenase-like predicted oxidoreductase